MEGSQGSVTQSKIFCLKSLSNKDYIEINIT